MFLLTLFLLQLLFHLFLFILFLLQLLFHFLLLILFLLQLLFHLLLLILLLLQFLFHFLLFTLFLLQFLLHSLLLLLHLLASLFHLRHLRLQRLHHLSLLLFPFLSLLFPQLLPQRRHLLLPLLSQRRHLLSQRLQRLLALFPRSLRVLQRCTQLCHLQRRSLQFLAARLRCRQRRLRLRLCLTQLPCLRFQAIRARRRLREKLLHRRELVLERRHQRVIGTPLGGHGLPKTLQLRVTWKDHTHFARLHLHLLLQLLILVLHRIGLGYDRARLLQLRLVLLNLFVKPMGHVEPSHRLLSDLRVTPQISYHPSESSSCPPSAARFQLPMCPFPPSSEFRALHELSSTSHAVQRTPLLDSRNPDSAEITDGSPRISG